MPDTQKNFYKKLLGKIGEKKAIKKMKKLGYKLIIANYVTPYGEADGVFEKDGEIVFLEVKTRSSNLFGEPKEAVNYYKQEKYKKIAKHYLLSHTEDSVSFAVAEVFDGEVNIIFNAF
jgi:putative endonuclease